MGFILYHASDRLMNLRIRWQGFCTFCLNLFCFVLLSSCTQTTNPAALESKLISNEKCRLISLIDSATQLPVIGAEDFAIDHEEDKLYISAYDRRSVERAAKKRANKKIPTGGLYAIDISQLRERAKKIHTISSLIRAEDIDGGLRPHGISYDQENQELAFINRAYYRNGNKWKMHPQLERIKINGAPILSEPNSLTCSANNLLQTNTKILISYDHKACNWYAGLEDIFSLRESGLKFANDGPVIFQKAGFANGVTNTATGDIALAATREKALHLFHENDSNISYKQAVKLPGGPDNLTISHDGAIIAALHPSLLRMGAHRKLGWGNSPSKLVRIDPATNMVTTLFHDVSGSLFSAATVGVETQKEIILGSVTQAGLLYCEKNS